MMDEYVMASRLAMEEMEAYRDSDYELMCELQKKRSEIHLDHEVEMNGTFIGPNDYIISPAEACIPPGLKGRK